MSKLELKNLVRKDKNNPPKGILEISAAVYPFSGLYFLGSLCQDFLEPLKLGYRQYRQWQGFYKQSEWWDKEKILDYQSKQLRGLIEHAYNNVPYYRELFDKSKLKPKDFKSTGDLQKLPVLTREDVKKNYDKLLAQNLDQKQIRKRLRLSYTSGSTGTPMSVYRDGLFEYRERIATSWALGYARVNLSEKNLWLRQRPFVYNQKIDKNFYEPYWMRLTLPTKNSSDDDLDEHLRLLGSFAPVYCIGSPSMMYLLAQRAKQLKLTSLRFKAFISKYENIYRFQQEAIEEQFHCRVFRYYSSEEFLLIAADCPQKSMHADIRKGILEIARDRQDSRQGRIIYTGFNNHIMPLIRYDTGDTGRLALEQCGCSRQTPILAELNGRGESIMFYNGRRICPITFSTVLDDQAENIAVKECQFVQKSEDELQVNIVPEKRHDIINQNQLRRLILHLVGEKINLQFNYLEHIPRTEMGKFQLVKKQFNKEK